jgi:hypothetical protein
MEESAFKACFFKGLVPYCPEVPDLFPCLPKEDPLASGVFDVSKGLLNAYGLKELALHEDDAYLPVPGVLGLEGYLPFHQVDVVPLETEDLFLPHPRMAGHYHDWCEA